MRLRNGARIKIIFNEKQVHLQGSDHALIMFADGTMDHPKGSDQRLVLSQLIRYHRARGRPDVAAAVHHWCRMTNGHEPPLRETP